MLRAASVTAAMLAAPVAPAGCGGSSPPSHAWQKTAFNSSGSALELAECMRTHGVPDFPDPKVGTGPGGHGVDISIGAQAGGTGQINRQSPVFQAANKVCMPLVGGPKGFPTKKAGS